MEGTQEDNGEGYKEKHNLEEVGEVGEERGGEGREAEWQRGKIREGGKEGEGGEERGEGKGEEGEWEGKVCWAPHNSVSRCLPCLA